MARPAKKKRKGKGGSKKGNPFEREICNRLSEWWAGRDDVFWRTGGSGGRGTVRGRKGKSTAGGCGDVCALDHVGKPLMDLVTFEIKRGYSKFTPFDLLDRSKTAKKQQWEEWIEKAILSQQNAKSKYWAIISRRDQREATIAMPFGLYNWLNLSNKAMVSLSTKLRDKTNIAMAIIKLEDFFDEINPKQLMRRLA